MYEYMSPEQGDEFGALLMEQTRTQDEELRTYLLGQCSAEEQKRVEERLLSDSHYFSGLEKVEESLTDEYVRGLIHGVEKEHFENHFLKSPQHQNDLQFARLLHRYFSTREATGETTALPAFPSRWRFVFELSLACVAIVLIGISAFLLREVTNLRGQTQRLQAERAGVEQHDQALAGQIQEQQRQMKELTQELTDLQKAPLTNNANMISLSLTPGIERSGAELPTATISPGTQRLRLRLQFDDGDYKNYQGELQTAEGRPVWSHDGLKSHPGSDRAGTVVDIVVPAAILTGGDYLVVLKGATRSRTPEVIGSYYFTVKRR